MRFFPFVVLQDSGGYGTVNFTSTFYRDVVTTIAEHDLFSLYTEKKMSFTMNFQQKTKRKHTLMGEKNGSTRAKCGSKQDTYSAFTILERIPK